MPEVPAGRGLMDERAQRHRGSLTVGLVLGCMIWHPHPLGARPGSPRTFEIPAWVNEMVAGRIARIDELLIRKDGTADAYLLTIRDTKATGQHGPIYRYD